MKTPDWSEVEAFCRIDGWEEVQEGRSPDHRYYRLVLDDGTVLETRVSHSQKKTMSDGRWKAILRDQLRVSAEDFWKALRTKRPVSRPSAPPDETEAEAVPAWAAATLSSQLHMSPADIAALGRDRAVELAQATWSRPLSEHEATQLAVEAQHRTRRTDHGVAWARRGRPRGTPNRCSASCRGSSPSPVTPDTP